MAQAQRNHFPKKVKFKPKDHQKKPPPGQVFVCINEDDVCSGEHALSKTGQKLLSGYSDDGYEVHGKWRKGNKKGHLLKKTAELEEKILAKSRVEHGIEAHAHANLKKGRKVKSGEIDGTKNAPIDLFSDSDVE